jgi:hypothetical protein
MSMSVLLGRLLPQKDHFTKNAEHVKLNFVDRYKKGLEFKLDLL